MNERGYCIFIDTFFQGAVPSCFEVEIEHGTEKVCVFATKRDAQLEIVDAMQIRLEQFIAGERDFEDAITCEEYVVEVEVLNDGTIRAIESGAIKHAG